MPGLHHAHELRGDTGERVGLVHRDVSPSNLFVTAAGVVKVLDFGIAKVAGAAETEAGTVKGKAQYMAPEQLLGEPVDRRADVFGLGVVLYELATHQRLFKRSSDYLAARAILEEPIPRADVADPAVPVALADLIACALARRPGDRFASAPQLAAALEAAFAPLGGVATPSQISAALAEQHADELTAQRTRQARIVDRARDVAATGQTAAARTVAAGAETNVATRVTISARRRRPTRRLAIGGAAAAIGVGMIVAGVAVFSRSDDDRPIVRSPDPIVRSPDPIVRSPDPHDRPVAGPDRPRRGAGPARIGILADERPSGPRERRQPHQRHPSEPTARLVQHRFEPVRTDLRRRSAAWRHPARAQIAGVGAAPHPRGARGQAVEGPRGRHPCR